LGHALQSWADAHGEAEVTAESGYILSDDPATVRGPDVAVVLDPERGADAPGGWMRGAPDLAVEVLSPSDSSTAIQQKTVDYLEAGAGLVWIVDPAARTVTTYRPDGSARLLRVDETLDGEDLLPGFTLALVTLFDR
jgi:Uma2 family endonuclease